MYGGTALLFNPRVFPGMKLYSYISVEEFSRKLTYFAKFAITLYNFVTVCVGEQHTLHVVTAVPEVDVRKLVVSFSC